jgi:hypothetical protein
MSTSGKIIIDDTAVDSFYLLDFASVGGFAADGLQTWAISLPTGEYMLLASATLVQNGPLLRFSQDGTAIVVGGLYTLPLGPKTSAILNPSQSSSESVQAAHQTPASIEGNSVLMDVKTFSGGPTTGHVVFEGKSPHPVTWTRGIYAMLVFTGIHRIL